MVSPAELAYTVGDKIPLYHPDGIGVGLRRWGEPPLRSACAIIQQTEQGWKPRTLLLEKCWRLQGLDIDQLQKLKQLGATPEPIASAAGNAITGAMATAVTTALAPRYEQHASLLLQHKATRYFLPMDAVPTAAVKHVHFIPVSLHPCPQGLVHSSLECTLSFPLADTTRAHKSSSGLASEHASQLLGTSVQAILCGHFESHTLVYMIPFDGT